ncbi:DUF6527 family protein [Deinococcus marmoris]|uniref:DUF6527 family protein n=1 Tax=Deinococcus marmoris TaxID=249408 RepID=UPI00267B14FF
MSAIRLHYRDVATVEHVTAAQETVTRHPDTIALVHRGHYRNAALVCPCGCGDVLVLNLDRNVDTTFWNLRLHESRLTLMPSVWRRDSCGAHFVLEENRVWWYGAQADTLETLPSNVERTLRAWWRRFRRKKR